MSPELVPARQLWPATQFSSILQQLLLLLSAALNSARYRKLETFEPQYLSSMSWTIASYARVRSLEGYLPLGVEPKGMLPKALSNDEPGVLEKLVEYQVHEGERLDYKREFTKKPAEWAKDLSSFANTAGGDIVLGVVEAVDSEGKKLGHASGLIGIPENLEQIKEYIESAVSPLINQRLPKLEFYKFGEYPNGNVIVIRIPKSRLVPHIVSDNDRFVCVKRNTYGKYYLDISAIREAILHGDMVSFQLSRFVRERIELNQGENNINPIGATLPRFLFHVLSFASFEGNIQLDGSSLRNLKGMLMPLGHGYDYPYANIDGFVTTANASGDEPRVSLTVLRQGQTELITNKFVRNDPARPSLFLRRAIDELIKHTMTMVELLHHLEIEAPYYATMTLLDCDKFFLNDVLMEWFEGPKIRFGRSVITSPIVELTGDASSIEQVNTDLRPIFEFLTQAGGLTQAPYYTSEGHLKAI